MADKALEGWDVYQVAGGWSAKKFAEGAWKELHVSTKDTLTKVAQQFDLEVEARAAKEAAYAEAEAAYAETVEVLNDEFGPR